MLTNVLVTISNRPSQSNSTFEARLYPVHGIKSTNTKKSVTGDNGDIELLFISDDKVLLTLIV